MINVPDFSTFSTITKTLTTRKTNQQNFKTKVRNNQAIYSKTNQLFTWFFVFISEARQTKNEERKKKIKKENLK